MKHLKICISGSFKYYDRMLHSAEIISAQNYTVLFPFRDAKFTNGNKDKELRNDELLENHFRRIDMCDILYVVNVDGYIGRNVQEEIDYAKKIDKPVIFAYPDKRQINNTMETLDKLEEIVRWMRVQLKLDESPSPSRSAEKSDNTKRQIVTLCGSRRFRDDFHEKLKELTLKGVIVLTPAIFDFTEYECEAILRDTDHETLDQIHNSKMDMSDYVLVINPGGYIGENTQKEIDYAKEHGIEIRYLVEAKEN